MVELVHFSDCGPYRSANQDAYCVRIAQTAAGLVALAVVCDGMGGLKHGEVASATVVNAFAAWFDGLSAAQLSAGLTDAAVNGAWGRLLQDSHEKIKRFGQAHALRLGTTVSALLLTPARYHLLQVGDSRIYLQDSQGTCQLTVDQTLATRELLAGRLSQEAFASDQRHHILLQCVGDRSVAPVFSQGRTPPAGACVLCSDGYYHHLSPSQLHGVLTCGVGRAALQQGLLGLGNTARALGEQDNMTCVALRWQTFAADAAATLSLLPEADGHAAPDILAKVSYTNTECVL